MQKKMHEVVILEYGAGTGMLCLLAKMLGLRTVLYNDIDDRITQDAQTIAKALNLEADKYFVGDIHLTIDEMRRRELKADLIVSYDCIEHIYDIDDFICHLGDLSQGALAFFIATGANPFNLKIRTQLMRIQRIAELKGRNPESWEWHKDSYRACRDIRYDIIRDYARGLSESDSKQMATLTRGMRADDIKDAVDMFIETGKLPAKPEHPTNTCEPNTGNFCERLMNPFELANKFRKEGFDIHVEPGYYGVGSNPSLKDFIRMVLNKFISSMPVRSSLRISPYYELVGARDAY